MATIKVKRNSNSRGKCKLAFNKVYTARVNPTYNRSYIIGNNVYLSEYFTIVTDQQPKPKPVVKPDPKTGKFVVEKPERDYSVPQAFPQEYEVPHGTRVIALENGTYSEEVCVSGDNGTVVYSYAKGGAQVIFDGRDSKMGSGWFMKSHELAPLNPTDHPEHPDFVKAKPAANWQKDIPFEFEFIESKPEPQPFDLREVIAKYIRQHGTQLTAIELIGHLTIEAKWQSTEK